MHRSRPSLLAALAAPLSAVALGTAPVQAASLPSTPGPRPGPDILYAPPAASPQLENAPGSVWTAPPILISGAVAYRDHELLYQDFLYDDHGAAGGQRDPNDARQHPGGNSSSGDIFSLPAGTYTYPTDPAYAGNAADLVELRIRPLADATAFRLTLNTLVDPQRVAATIAIGTSPAPVLLPFGTNTTAPAQYALTVHGTTAEFTTGSGAAAGTATPTVAVDSLRRQVEVRIPHADWDPGTSTVRIAAAVGLWDATAHRYLLPRVSADSTHPGGSGTLATPSAFFNVAFRTAEPLPDVADPRNVLSRPAWWRDQAQADALRRNTIADFHEDVDFGKLASGVADDSGVPTSGPMDRILASHFERAQGTDYSSACQSAMSCPGELRGRLQPYAVYIPHTGPGPDGYGLTLLLHSLSANYNQFLGSHNQSQFGERGTGSIVVTPEGRGPDGWYYDVAGADTFEVWADIASHYTLDPTWTAIGGYSMGGYGTYKLATQFPDLFARAQPTVGPPGLGVWVPPAPPLPGGDDSNTNAMLASLRNIPVLMWVALNDELVPFAGAQAQARSVDSLGYRYTFDVFHPAEHLTLSANDQFAPAASFLGTARVDLNPAHVSYVVNPTMDFPADLMVADHAYWLSALRVRDRAAAHRGTIDVRSEGFGAGDPAPSGTRPGAGVLTGGNLGALPYTEQAQSWGPVPATAPADGLDITATNVSTVTVDTARARVDCNVDLRVTTDGPLTVVLAGCGRSATFGVAAAAPGAPVTLPNTAAGRGAGGAGALAASLCLGLGAAAGARRRRHAVTGLSHRR